MSDAQNIPFITGAETFLAALVAAGADQATAQPKLAPITVLGRIARLFMPAGNTTLTLAHGRSGILTSTVAGSTSLLVPTLATLVYTRDPSNPLELSFLFQRGGTGPLFVNPDTGVTIIWNDLDPQFLTQDHPPVMLTMVRANVWAAS